MRNDFDASLLWRHIGSMDAQANEAAALFPAFPQRQLAGLLRSDLRLCLERHGSNFAARRERADEDPPILGNETGSTSFNSGNTFPSLFDTMGRTYSISLKLTF